MSETNDEWLSKREKLAGKKETTCCALTLELKAEVKVMPTTLRTHHGSNEKC